MSVLPDPDRNNVKQVEVVPDADSEIGTKLRKHHLKAVDSGVVSALARGKYTAERDRSKDCYQIFPFRKRTIGAIENV